MNTNKTLLAAIAVIGSMASCGIGSHVRENMCNEVANLSEYISPFAPEIKLDSIYKGEMEGTNSVYLANFKCAFVDSGHNVAIEGVIGFNQIGKYGIAENFSIKDKMPVMFTSVCIDGDSVSTTRNKYCHPYFILSDSVMPKAESFIEKIERKTISQLKSWGAVDAYFDDHVLVYIVNDSDISGNPNMVAKSVYELFPEVPLYGVRVVSASTKKTLGEYYIKK